jgi:ATP-dependent helicase HrpA
VVGPRSRGTALTTERVTLFGLTLVADRTVPVGSIDPALARRLFIDHALVDGEWDSHHRFVAQNADRIAEVEALGARARRDLLAPPDRIAEFFHERLPDHVVSVRHFDRWWKRRRTRDPDLFDLPVEVLIDPSAGGVRPGRTSPTPGT